MIERIEIHVTALSTRLKRIFASGTYDTGPDESITSKPVLVKVHADGVVGYGLSRPISPRLSPRRRARGPSRQGAQGATTAPSRRRGSPPVLDRPGR